MESDNDNYLSVETPQQSPLCIMENTLSHSKKLTAKEKKEISKQKRADAISRFKERQRQPKPVALRPRKNYKEIFLKSILKTAQQAYEKTSASTNETAVTTTPFGFRNSLRNSSKVTETVHKLNVSNLMKKKKYYDPSDAFKSFQLLIPQIWKSSSSLREQEFVIHQPNPVWITTGDCVVAHVPATVENVRLQLNQYPYHRSNQDKAKVSYYNQQWEYWIIHQFCLALVSYFTTFGPSEETESEGKKVELLTVMDEAIGIIPSFIDWISRPAPGPLLPRPVVIRNHQEQEQLSNEIILPAWDGGYHSLESIPKSLTRRSLNYNDPPFKSLPKHAPRSTFGLYKGWTIRVDDMMSLIPGTELTSPIIDTCGTIIRQLAMSQPNTRKFVFISHFDFVNAISFRDEDFFKTIRDCIKVQQMKAPEVNLLIVPLVPGFHFVLAFIDLKTFQIKLYDPLYNGEAFDEKEKPANSYLLNELDKLRDLLEIITTAPSNEWIPKGRRWERFEAPSCLGTQTGKLDCGIYCLLFLEVFSHLIIPPDYTTGSNNCEFKELFDNATKHHFDKARKRYFLLIQETLRKEGGLRSLTTDQSITCRNSADESTVIPQLSPSNRETHSSSYEQSGEESDDATDVIDMNDRSLSMQVPTSSSESPTSSERMFFTMDTNETMGDPFALDVITSSSDGDDHVESENVSHLQSLSQPTIKKSKRRFIKGPVRMRPSPTKVKCSTKQEKIKKSNVKYLPAIKQFKTTYQQTKTRKKSGHKTTDITSHASTHQTALASNSSTGEASQRVMTQLKSMTSRQKQREAGKILSNDMIISVKFADLENLLIGKERLSSTLVEAIGTCIQKKRAQMEQSFQFTFVKFKDALAIINDPVNKSQTKNPSSLFTLLTTIITTGRIIIPFDYQSTHWILIVVEYKDETIFVYDPKMANNSIITDENLLSVLKRIGDCVKRVLSHESETFNKTKILLNREKLWKINESYLCSDKIFLQYKNDKGMSKSDSINDGLLILAFLEQYTHSNDFSTAASKQIGKVRGNAQLKRSDSIRKEFFNQIVEALSLL